MKDFLEISQLTAEQIEDSIQRALYFKNHSSYPCYPQYTVAHLFYENSTRTRVSFEMAAQHLDMCVINLDMDTSSENKGEAVEDTILNLTAMGISHFVVRHSQEYLPKLLARLNPENHIINAGDGTHAHPSQALLDLMTIYEQKPHIPKLKVAIVGDIRHSRVANSLQCIFQAFNIRELVLVAPELWQPERVHYGHVSHDISEGLNEADVIICLRIQQERLRESEQLSINDYKKYYMLDKEKLKLAKRDAMVLHPGPVNRGVEISDEVIRSPQSYILNQATNGVYARMAILESLIDNKH